VLERSARPRLHLLLHLLTALVLVLQLPATTFRFHPCRKKKARHDEGSGSK
jgi:hypothetical protein